MVVSLVGWYYLGIAGLLKNLEVKTIISEKLYDNTLLSARIVVYEAVELPKTPRNETKKMFHCERQDNSFN